MSGNEHIPVGVLVADIKTNELQALSDEYPDELKVGLSCLSQRALDDHDTMQRTGKREYGCLRGLQ